MLVRARSRAFAAHDTTRSRAMAKGDRNRGEARMTVSIALWLLACTRADDSPSVSDDGAGGATDDGGTGDAGDGGSGDDAGSGGDDATGGGDDGTGGDPLLSNVEAVAATEDSGAYTVAVTLHSPDVDCDQYSD